MKHVGQYRHASAVMASVLALMAAGDAGAQTATTADTAESGAEMDGNSIIVTANRRASPLATVPIAVSAVSAASLQNSGASDIRQLNQLAPSLFVSSTGSEANGVARIRGIGTVGDNPGLESSVAVFIDGVYRSRTGSGLNDLGEVERIEVLRGPQGTLFGRNTSAGLVNIVTKAPSFTLGATGEITYGNYDYWRLAAGVTGPISEKVALRLDGVWSKRDGFLKVRDKTGITGDTNDRDRYLLRGQMLLEPSDALSVRLIGDYSRRDESCCGAVYTSTREVFDPTTGTTGDFSVSPSNRIANILNAMAPGSALATPDPYARTAYITTGRNYVSKLRDWGLSGEINYDFGGTKLTSITAYRDYKSRDYGDYDYTGADILYRDPNTYRQFKTFTQELRLQGAAFSDKLDWLLGGYYSHEDLTLRDNIVFGADYGRFATCRILAGSGITSNLSGAQYGLCAQPIDGNVATPDIGNLITAAVPAPLRPAFTALATIPAGTGDTDSRYFQKSESIAVFAHNIFHVTNRLDVTVGLRWTHESKKFAASLQNNNAVCPALQTSLAGAVSGGLGAAAAQAAKALLTLACLGNSSTSLNGLNLRDKFSDNELSGTGVISWKPFDGVMAYASYSRGYKAGGYNLDRFELGNTGLSALSSSPATYFTPRSNADASSLRFAAEKVNAYELGLKFTAQHWSANAALFRQEFKNFQLNTFNGTSFVVQNINGCSSTLSATHTCASGDVEAGLVSEGLELELAASPVKDVRLGAGITVANAKYSNILVGSSDGQTPLDTALFLLPGARNSNAPQVVTTFSLAWTPEIGSSGLSALFYFDGRGTSGYNTGSDLFPEKYQKGYSVYNARVGLRGPNQQWAVEFWGQNIFNRKYTQVTINSPLQGSGSAAQVQQLGTAGGFASGTQLFSSYLAEPRTYGVTLRGKF